MNYPPPWQDLATLAKHICVSETTIERWVRNGTFPGPTFKAGEKGMRLWRWRDVEKHLAAGATAEAASRPDPEKMKEAVRHAINGTR